MKESKKTRKPTEPINKTAEPSRTEPTVAARNEESNGGGGNNAMTVPLAVVGCLLLLGVVILVVVWSRRRSARASQGKEKGSHELSVFIWDRRGSPYRSFGAGCTMPV